MHCQKSDLFAIVAAALTMSKYLSMTYSFISSVGMTLLPVHPAGMLATTTSSIVRFCDYLHITNQEEEIKRSI